MDHVPVLVGYLLKRTASKPDGLVAPGAVDICSVSGCISPAIDCNDDLWIHNALQIFNTEADARAAIAADADGTGADMYAYKLLPAGFDGTGETTLDIAALPQWGEPVAAAELPSNYECLGFDCVQTDWARAISGFGCSPLSCNGMAAGIAVNRFCLIDSLDNAIAAARRFAKEQPEPGTYYVVEVWRKRRAAKAGLDGV